MLKCREIAERASDYVDGHLSLRQRLAVAFHLLLCGNCRDFIRQLRLALRFYSGIPAPQTTEQEADQVVRKVMENTDR